MPFFRTYDESLLLRNSMGEDKISPSKSGAAYKLLHAGEHSLFQIEAMIGTSNQISDIMAQIAEEQTNLIHSLAAFLDNFIQDSNRFQIIEASSFDGTIPYFTTTYYVDRIAVHCGASPCCLIASLLYLERIQRRSPAMRLTSRTLQRLLLVATMTAVKFLEDAVCPNTHWAQIGGIPLYELNALELDFLFAIGFDLAVSPGDYTRCAAALREFAARRRGPPSAVKAPPPTRAYPCKAAGLVRPGPFMTVKSGASPPHSPRSRHPPKRAAVAPAGAAKGPTDPSTVRAGRIDPCRGTAAPCPDPATRKARPGRTIRVGRPAGHSLAGRTREAYGDRGPRRGGAAILSESTADGIHRAAPPRRASGGAHDSDILAPRLGCSP